MSSTGVREPVPETVRFQESVFSLDVVKKALYRFIDRVAADVRAEAGEIVCVLTFLRPVSEETARAIVADLQAEVLDQDLRQRIADETAGIRNTVLALAFSKTDLPKP